jgi:signal peptidase II
MNRFAAPLLILAVFALDRATKAWALGELRLAGSVEALPFVRLTYAENTGVAFGMFRDSNSFFLWLSCAMVAGLLFYRRRIQAHGRAAALGVTLVLAGALGNIYDRMVYGFVVDFVDLSFFPAIFNAADSAITAGAALLAWGMRDAKDGAAERGAL